MDKPIYTIFAGVNGAGKSSMYRANPVKTSEKRVNVDEMVQKLGDWRDNKIQIEASKKAVREIKENLDQRISFNQETTLSGKSVAGHIKKAKENGFEVNMNYVGLDSADIAKQRVAQRESKGGHGIPDDLIVKRYSASLENLKQILPLCDRVNIFDNTVQFDLVAKIKDGVIVEQKNCRWLDPILQEYETARVSQQIKQAGYRPSETLVQDMKQLNRAFGKELSVKEVKEHFKNPGSLDGQKRKLIDKAAGDFIQAEKELVSQKMTGHIKPPCPEP